MPTPKRFTHFAICCAAILAIGCAKKDQQATDTAAADAGGLTAADLTGKWNIRAVPYSGDTTATTFVLAATSDNNGWTVTYPNRPRIATRVRFDGDSVMTEAGPYESVRRKGVQVSTAAVVRLEDGTLVGTSVARYATRGVDSVMRFRISGSRAP